MATLDPPLNAETRRRAAAAAATATRRVVLERLASWVVIGGGVGVIASILGILAFLVIEVLPLMASPSVSAARRGALPGPLPGAVLVDEHRTHLATLAPDGVVRVLSLGSGDTVLERDLASELGLATPLAPVLAEPDDGRMLAGTADGSVLALPVRFAVSFDAQDRVVTPELGEPLRVDLEPEGGAVTALAARVEDDRTTFVAQQAAGPVSLVRSEVTTHMFTGETETRLARGRLETPAPLSQVLLDRDQRNLYGVSEDGRLLWWQIQGTAAGPPKLLSEGTSAVTTATLLIGDRGLLAGREDGTVNVWAQALLEGGGGIAPRHLRAFRRLDAPVALLAASGRGRSFLAQDADGRLGLFFSTSHRTLWRGPSPLADARLLAFAPKGDAAFLVGESGWQEVAIRNEHPESSLATFFGRIWYEGYEQPEFVWQSTGGTDDFEPKLSLTPLLFGTLKATLYSMALAIPLAVLAAVYVAQFTHPRLSRWIKPTIEIMASLPSVVLGFLAGLWLAPRLEGAFPALVLMIVGLPFVSILAGALWNRLPQRWRGRFPDGWEVAWYAVALALGAGACLWLSPALESAVFAGDFPRWLGSTTGLDYQQRNAIVVGIAMGFAVIPIIFAISEDALSNVPRDLVAGSLALGADRWETVVKVVLPTASPGIFSAIMVGFGRAIGETMIVLMATGNTPIMDWSAFNGFRTLSANIAVEIPEAPVGSTLYRTLFVAAILLFAVTFAVNTAAELVRQRLRNKYAKL